ncbi:hypothetical protein TUBRATIS_18110 [Tubulinosema ratisbonensis]|uniref:Uncharacterized protein n=1 Tax=Tubulinosema ratisbonensis TaxID=291195 RepID=A0A437AKK9_9MICR|nr:hypothetical protein TUBRATIS_18110 [Tubulinosema ratisbonensis]
MFLILLQIMKFANYEYTSYYDDSMYYFAEKFFLNRIQSFDNSQGTETMELSSSQACVDKYQDVSSYPFTAHPLIYLEFKVGDCQFPLFDSVNYITNNFIFDFSFICIVYFKINIEETTSSYNLCLLPEFRMNFEDQISKYLFDKEINNNFITCQDLNKSYVYMKENFTEFTRIFNQRSIELQGVVYNFIDYNLTPVIFKAELTNKHTEESVILSDIKKLLFSDRFAIINILFPELEIIFNYLNGKSNLKKIHLLFNYIAFKIKINEQFLKNDLIKTLKKGMKSIICCQMILRFIFYTRLDFTIFAFGLSLGDNIQNLLITLTYLSFTRAKYPGTINCCDFHDLLAQKLVSPEEIFHFIGEFFIIKIQQNGKNQLIETFTRKLELETESTKLFKNFIKNKMLNIENTNKKLSENPINIFSFLYFISIKTLENLQKYFKIS